MKKNKKESGFTLIELLAVIVILGVIMTVAIPNIVYTLDKNKRGSVLTDARRAVTSAEYTIRTNTSYSWPDSTTVVIIPLSKVKKLDLETTSFNTVYDLNRSFVAFTRQPVNDGSADNFYDYYVHLVSCGTDNSGCSSGDVNKIADNVGINLVEYKKLEDIGKYDLVARGSDLKLNYLEGSRDELLSKFRAILGKSGSDPLSLVVY